VAQLLDTVPEKVLAIYAHPDDPDVSCGGTLARFAQQGSEVHVVLCTNGDKGTTDPAVDPAQLAIRRAAECDEAAKVLGLTGQHVLGYRDGELTDDEAFRESSSGGSGGCAEHGSVPDPTAVFFGEDYFNHRDHRIVGFAVLDALSPAAALPLYFPTPVRCIRWRRLCSRERSSDGVGGRLGHHRGQGSGRVVPPEPIRRRRRVAANAVRTRAAEDGRRAGVAFAEGFRRLRLSV